MSEAAIILLAPSEAWEAEGRLLGERERSSEALMWDIGDWWRRGENYEDRAQLAGRPGMPTLGTCYVAGSIAKRWPALMRIKALSWNHHQVAAPVKDDVQARALLLWCLETDPPRSVEQLRTEMKRRKRAAKEAELGAIQSAVSGRYGVIYADPPWRFEPYSRDTGMDRAADNHYPTMTGESLLDMEVMRTAAADDCVLFCWATAPMLREALEWMAHYGFEYRSHCVWVKEHSGTGYWFRNQHELLLVGVRGEVPAPAPGTQFASVTQLAASRHSEKPAAFAEMIEEMFPSLPAIELFARGPRLGWTVWGNEA